MIKTVTAFHNGLTYKVGEHGRLFKRVQGSWVSANLDSFGEKQVSRKLKEARIRFKEATKVAQ